VARSAGVVSPRFFSPRFSSPRSSPPPAHAQPYPSRPVRLIVSLSTGRLDRYPRRALGQKLSEGLAQPVVIDNRPGAGGSIGSEAAAKSAPTATRC